MGAVNSIYLPGTITFSHLAVKKWSLAWATNEQWRQPSMPFLRHIVPLVHQFQSLYTPPPHGQLPRHIVRQFQFPYTPSLRGLTRISARQHAGVSMKWPWHWLHVSHMLSFQIKDMEFTGWRLQLSRELTSALCLCQSIPWVPNPPPPAFVRHSQLYLFPGLGICFLQVSPGVGNFLEAKKSNIYCLFRHLAVL
jgi:hypothetical protein